jgi:hypothetical protein
MNSQVELSTFQKILDIWRSKKNLRYVRPVCNDPCNVGKLSLYFTLL